MFKLSDVKPTLYTWVAVGIMAVTFITLGKFVFTKYPVKGLSQLFQAA